MTCGRQHALCSVMRYSLWPVWAAATHARQGSVTLGALCVMDQPKQVITPCYVVDTVARARGGVVHTRVSQPCGQPHLGPTWGLTAHSIAPPGDITDCRHACRTMTADAGFAVRVACVRAQPQDENCVTGTSRRLGSSTSEPTEGPPSSTADSLNELRRGEAINGWIE